MTAMKCDRCGKYYDYYFKREVNGKNVRSQNSISLYLKDDYGNWADKKCYDLCPECMDKMVDFLEGRNDDKPKNKFKVKNLL